MLSVAAGDLGQLDAVAELNTWAATLPGAMIYASPAFGRVLEDMLPGDLRWLVARRDGQVVGVLPYMEHAAEPFGRVVNSLPWYGTHGGCWLADPEDAAARGALLEAYGAVARADDVLSATMVLTPVETRYLDVYEAALAPREFDHRIGQVTVLPSEAEDPETELMATIRQKTRNLVRKSLKQDFTEEVTDADWAWEFLHAVHVENMTAVGGRPKPSDHFAAFRKGLPPDCRRLSVAMLEGEPVAAMLLFAFGGTCEYITPVIKVEHRALQPLSFLIWHGMRWAMARGCTEWNWGGTWHTQKSLHHFKAGWGAEDRPYTYVINARADAPRVLGRDLARASEAFPFYYLYPFDKLDRP